MPLRSAIRCRPGRSNIHLGLPHLFAQLDEFGDVLFGDIRVAAACHPQGAGENG
jgi:hypothetical protein